MSAIATLADLIERHQLVTSTGSSHIDAWCSECPWEKKIVGEAAVREAHALHVAETIADSAGLAVVETPDPDVAETSVWRVSERPQPGFKEGGYVRTRYWPAGTRIGAHGVSDMTLSEAERAGVSLLAAVSDAKRWEAPQ